MSSLAVLCGSRSLIKRGFLKNAVCRGRSVGHSRSSHLPVLPPGSRFSSSAPPTAPSESPAPLEKSEPVVTETAEQTELQTEDVDKPRVRRTRITTVSPKDVEPVEIPEGLDILWYPSEDDVEIPTTALPPTEVFEEALHNLHITLHPQTQYRAAYSSASGPPTEPTLGLYCPIEGGDYIIDATVRALALRTGAEVLVLDAVQLAAGEWGHFGKAASSLQLPRNPLHFTSPTTASRSPSRRNAESTEEDDDDDYSFPFFPPPQPMALSLMVPTIPGRGAIVASSPRRTPTPPSKVKVFFDALVNTPSKGAPSSASTTSDRPRIIYIRDFPTLAPTSDVWYPPLLSAVRARRRGPISRPSSAVANPMTIVFGMTPPLVPAYPPSSPEHGLMSLLMSRVGRYSPYGSSSGSAGGKTVAGSGNKVDSWGEDEVAEKARERRLRERLRRWEKGDAALYSEFPALASASEGEEDGAMSSNSGSSSNGHGRGGRPDVLVIGGPGMVPLPSLFGGGGGNGSGSRSGGSGNTDRSTFFRASVLVPSVRLPALEKATRMERRREINELTMRMGVGAVGGRVEESSFVSTVPSENENVEEENSNEDREDATEEKLERQQLRLVTTSYEEMWKDWGNRLEPWADVKRIADRAIGDIMSTSRTKLPPVSTPKSERSSLEPTLVHWNVITSAWASHRAQKHIRKTWLKEVSPLHGIKEDEGEDEVEDQRKAGIDEVVEKLKADGELDPHEERLLPCIVNPATMPTSFNQVHLPPHTIDSVRTIVSLPLLHPQAFKQGILKDHSMTGCLLFGPPGTGKTLVVRALAKEAGCRMLVVSPSDVMDMYVGEGEKLVRAVFSLARKLSPCVIFLDEMDALFGSRTSIRESGGAFAHRGVITEFMQEMDGLKSSREDNVIVIGATNRPFDLDDAVLRRLPRRLLVDLPGEKERAQILKIHLRDEFLAPDVDINKLAKQTESFSGSDLKHLCVSAALDAVKERVRLPWLTTSLPVVDTLRTEASSRSTSNSDRTDPVTDSEVNPTAVPSTLPQGAAEVITQEHGGGNISAQTNVDNNGVEQEPGASGSNPPVYPRVLYPHNFAKALKEITPSSSEALGSLAELRKWNEEFGEGRLDRKRQQVWGKGKFGFVNHPKSGSEGGEEGKVVPSTSTTGSHILDMLDRHQGS